LFLSKKSLFIISISVINAVLIPETPKTDKDAVGIRRKTNARKKKRKKTNKTKIKRK